MFLFDRRCVYARGHSTNYSHLPVFLTAATSTRDTRHIHLPFDLVSICPSLFLILSVIRFTARPNTGNQGTQLLGVKLSHRFLTDSPHMGLGLKCVLEMEKINSLMGKWLWLLSLFPSLSFFSETLVCPLTPCV